MLKIPPEMPLSNVVHSIPSYESITWLMNYFRILNVPKISSDRYEISSQCLFHQKGERGKFNQTTEKDFYLGWSRRIPVNSMDNNPTVTIIPWSKQVVSSLQAQCQQKFDVSTWMRWTPVLSWNSIFWHWSEKLCLCFHDFPPSPLYNTY